MDSRRDGNGLESSLANGRHPPDNGMVQLDGDDLEPETAPHGIPKPDVGSPGGRPAGGANAPAPAPGARRVGESRIAIDNPPVQPVAPQSTMIEPLGIDSRDPDTAENQGQHPAGPGYSGAPPAPSFAAASFPAPAPQAPMQLEVQGNAPPATARGTLNGVHHDVLTSAQSDSVISHARPYASFDEDDEMEGAATRIETAASLGIQQEEAPLEPEPSRPVFEVIGGNDRGKEFPIGHGDHTIGRSLESEIVLADIAVSRKHTLVCEENGLFVLRDLGSGNGTLVNGKPVHTYHLKEGDQIELGNTLLRFRVSRTSFADAPTGIAIHAGGPAEGQSPGPTPMGDPLDSLVKAGDYQTPHPETKAADSFSGALDRTSAGRRGLSRRQRLLIFGGGGAVLFLLLAVALKLVISKKPASETPPQVDASAEAAKHFALGMKYARTRKWKKAREHCQRVYVLAPGFEQAKSCASRASSEAKAKESLAQAETSLKSSKFELARTKLSTISTRSVYAADARHLKQRVDDQQVDTLIAQAKALSAKNDREGALSKIKTARKIAPTNEVLKKLYDQLGSADGVPPAAVAKRALARAPRRRVIPRRRRVKRTNRAATRRRTPHRGRSLKLGGSRAWLKSYQRRDFFGAEKALRARAGKLRGRRKASALKLAQAVKAVHAAWSGAERAERRDPPRALKLYGAAINQDKKIPSSPHGKTLTSKLVQVARLYANASVAGGRWTAAYRAMRTAQRYGAPASKLQQIRKKLEAKAMSLFETGYAARSSNRRRSRKLWKQVLKMVPASSPAYQKAYRWLNSGQSSYQDEDE